mmetsp:Transcript_32410/g.79029  ORF Transcript_32410/g.79029 Transcript_32410/m.79029 type:complete len:456 (-) Transcript_32410:58-1425(-)
MQSASSSWFSTSAVATVNLLFLAVVRNAQSALPPELAGDLPTSCDVCVPFLTETRACLRTCSNTDAYINNSTINIGEWYMGDDSESLLTQCLDDDRGNQDETLTPYGLAELEGLDPTAYVVDEFTGETVDLTLLQNRGIDGLVNCCSAASGFVEAGCVETFENTEFCISACISPCVIQTTVSYFGCINVNSPPPVGNGQCDQAQCVEQLVQSVNDAQAQNNGPIVQPAPGNNVQLNGQQIFSIQSISELSFGGLNGFGENGQDDCAVLEPFISSVCSAGECCAECDDELSDTLDCLINDFVITFSQLETDNDFEDCTIADDCSLQLADSDATRRKLASSFVRDVVEVRNEKEKKSRDLQTAEERDAAVEQATEVCSEQLTVDTIVYNHTYAAGRFVDCVQKEMLGILGPNSNSTDPTGAPVPSGGNGMAVSSWFGYHITISVVVSTITVFAFLQL